jgi:hypothetical protein
VAALCQLAFEDSLRKSRFPTALTSATRVASQVSLGLTELPFLFAAAKLGRAEPTEQPVKSGCRGPHPGRRRRIGGRQLAPEWCAASVDPSVALRQD